MTCRIFSGALVFLLLLAPATGRAFKRTQVGDGLKDFALPSSSGEVVRLSESLGDKATLLVFWATWSPRSTEALEDFQRLYEERRGEGLRVVAVNVEHQEWDPADGERLEAFAGERGLTFPVLFDRDLGIFNEYGVIAVPSTALLGPGGQVVELLEGYSHMTRDGFRERVLRALGVLEPTPEVSAEPAGHLPAGKAARYVQMGEILLERKMPSKAERAFRQALREDPEWAGAHRGLALALEAQGKGEEAARARRRAQELAAAEPGEDPDAGPGEPAPPAVPDPAAARYLRMGSLLLERGMASAAEGAFRKAAAEAPEDPEALRKLAEALDAQGKAPDAAEARERAAGLEAAKSQQ